MATIAPAPLPSKPFVRYQSVLIPLVQFLQWVGRTFDVRLYGSIAVVITGNLARQPAQVALRNLAGSQIVEWNVQMAGALKG